MKLRRFFACMMALLLVCGLPLTAFAAEYDLAQGSVTVNASESGQTVTHGSNAPVQDSAPVITQSTETTTNTISIQAEGNATANVTIQDVNIVISDPSGSPQDHSGQAAVTIDVADGAEANVTLDGVTIDVAGTGGRDPDIGKHVGGEAAVQITGNGDVTLELDGENTLQSGHLRAGVEKNTTAATETEPANGTGKLTITDENETQGSLEATGGSGGAGIGGGWLGSGSNITIEGNAQVTAQGGHSGAGIGGGQSGSGSNITITGSAEVTAKGSVNGAGIGGGLFGSGSNITITGSAEVTAQGGLMASGIGGGTQGIGSDITVSQDAQVKAQGGNAGGAWGAGAAIGNGGAQYQNGQEVAPNPNDLNEGWIAKYAPGTTDMNTATPDSLTYKDTDGTVQTVTESITVLPAQSATDNTHEQKAGFKVGDVEVAVKTHRYGNYQSDDNATCTHDGTESAKCTVPGCTKTHTIPDPGTIKEHSFTNYISDKNATYDADGTKTAKCDHCDATHTIPDPGSKLVREETAQTESLYRVIGQDGKAISCKAEQNGGVLTITVEADFATLTGGLSGMKTLKAQGVETVVFVTNGATSTFAIEDLLAQGASGDSYTLTHDGQTVTFTLGNGTDIGKILK